MSKAQKLFNAGGWAIECFEMDDGDHACEHGHEGCSNTNGGACAKELYSLIAADQPA